MLAAFAAFSFLASGSILPTTYAVKTDGPRQLLPSGLYLLRVVGVLFRPHPLPVLLALAGVLRLCERLRTPRDRGLLPALWVVALPLAYALYDSPDAPMMVGNFGRYYFPLFPFVLVLAGVALEEPLRRLADAPARWLAVALVLLAALLLVPPLTSLAKGRERYATQRAQRRRERRRDVALDPRPSARRRLDRGAGRGGDRLPHSQPLDRPRPGSRPPRSCPASSAQRAGTAADARGWCASSRERRPDYLMLFADSYPGLLEELRAEVVARRRIEHNVTMAGQDLVLARPSWATAALPCERSGEVDDRDHGEAPEPHVDQERWVAQDRLGRVARIAHLVDQVEVAEDPEQDERQRVDQRGRCRTSRPSPAPACRARSRRPSRR